MSSKNNNPQSRRTTSIAKSINRSLWFQRFGDTLLMDILFVLLVCSVFFLYCESQARETAGVQGTFSDRNVSAHYFLTKDSDPDTLQYVVKINDTESVFEIGPLLPFVRAAVAIALTAQIIHLFLALFHTSEIRRKLKPLNDLAIQAEQMSSMPFDSNKFESLELAIERISPDEPQAVHTGDKDLQSIEVALNNLLRRMKESQQQQARFVSDASHELRTPIAVIQGYVNMLDRWGKQDEAVLTESIEALKNESQHMKDLVEQLLFLARGDSGKNTLHPAILDLNEVVREVWEESTMIDESHPYKLTECTGAYVYADLSMIKQSIRIFVQNASKYSHAGDTIRLGVRCTNDSVSYIVQDEGIGMSESEVVHIFERFYRSDEARSTENGGSGLGLSIAKWIIDAHDGVIEVLSRPEFGTRFTVTLKRADPKAKANGYSTT